MRIFTRSLLTITVLAAGLVTAPAVAQAGIIPASSIVVSPASVETGASFTVTGFGWNCGDVNLTITLGAGAPVPLGTIVYTDITFGGFTAPFTAPAVAGAYVVTATEGECQGLATDDLTVTDPPTTTTSTTTTSTTTTSTTTTTLAPTTTTTLAPTTTTTLAATTTVVPAAAPPTPAATLPQTGDGSETLGIGAALVIALGTMFLLVARRPKHS